MRSIRQRRESERTCQHSGSILATNERAPVYKLGDYETKLSEQAEFREFSPMNAIRRMQSSECSPMNSGECYPPDCSEIHWMKTAKICGMPRQFFVQLLAICPDGPFVVSAARCFVKFVKLPLSAETKRNANHFAKYSKVHAANYSPLNSIKTNSDLMTL